MGPDLLARLLDEHGSALVLYARTWCNTPDDVVQQALLKLVRQPRLPERPVPWLYRVVRNEAISASRALQRRRRHETAAAERAASWFVPATGDRLDAAEAARALAKLPQREREVIVARLWGGLSFEEIAEVMEASSTSTHRWYEAGLAALRERLEATCPITTKNLKS